MALRLTSTPSPSNGSAAAPAARASADSLGLRARAIVAAGDLNAYAGLFDEAAAHPEPQRRYQAHVALLEYGMGGAAQVSDAVATRTFAVAADQALRLLESEPSEPALLNFAGIACYELWTLDAASELFKAARRLDPELPSIDRNLQECARRRRGGRPARPLHASVPGLARRARAVAARARPVTGLTISLCMIVKNEEQMLGKCLAAAAPAVDEMVIVDTGSTDATIEIARSFGARVIEFPWTGSFSEARNVSFEAATGDWLLYLDADEVLVADDAPRLRALAGRTWREAFYLVETSYLGELGDGSALSNSALRLFRNRPGYRFEGRLHEQIIQTLPTWAPGRLEQTGIRVTHYGYLGSVREAKEKSRRNVELLRAQAAESAPTPFLHFNLGSEYAAAGEPALAVDELQRAWTMLSAEDGLATREFVPLLVVRLVRVLRICGRLDEARAMTEQGLALFPDLTDLVFASAANAHAQGHDDEAVPLYERCLELGDAPARYGAMVGCGTFLPRVILAERHLTRGEVGAARELLEWCVEHHPEFVPVAGPYATALLRDGMAPDAVIEAMNRLDGLTPQVREAVAGALAGAGALAAAEQQYRLALAAVPGSTRVRVALAQLLLGRRDWSAAADVAAAVEADDPYAALAARIELIATVGRAGPEQARAALTRAQRAGLPEAEQEIFGAWCAIAEGDPAPAGLPVAGVPVLGVILQTLLSGGDTERFASLLPALEASRLERREQRQLLAEMYLGAGMLAAAAQEWMAVCSQAPDARALTGLASVAAAHGMHEDAATFATGALELDPACEPARALLNGLTAAPA